MSRRPDELWIAAITETVASYRRMLDGILAQLSDEELRARPQAGMNSVAVIVRHIGGNLRSRWTDFLTTDGEKPDRDRDREFMDWEGDRASLMAHLDTGWNALTSAIGTINASNADRVIFIRGEGQTVAEALTRSITHLSYHIGQIAFLARLVHPGPWKWLTIPPNQSEEYNRTTWGTGPAPSASRRAFILRALVPAAAVIYGPSMLVALYAIAFVPCSHCKVAAAVVIPPGPALLPLDLLRQTLGMPRPGDLTGYAIALVVSVLLLAGLSALMRLGRGLALLCALAGLPVTTLIAIVTLRMIQM